MLYKIKRLKNLMKTKIIIKDKFFKKCSLLYSKMELNINGVNNYIEIGKNIDIHNKLVIQCNGDRNRIVIEDNCIFWGTTELRADSKSLIMIGNGTGIGSAVIHASECSKIEIGADCMLSHEVDIRSADGHCIYDKGNLRKRINSPATVLIGKHVWLGKRVQCLKGAEIRNGSVVGAGSLVTKSFKEENIIIAGSPAKVIRRGIKWKR